MTCVRPFSACPSFVPSPCLAPASGHPFPREGGRPSKAPPPSRTAAPRAPRVSYLRARAVVVVVVGSRIRLIGAAPRHRGFLPCIEAGALGHMTHDMPAGVSVVSKIELGGFPLSDRRRSAVRRTILVMRRRSYIIGASQSVVLCPRTPEERYWGMLPTLHVGEHGSRRTVSRGPLLITGPRSWLFLPFRGSYDHETSLYLPARCART
jgi:hypothetical protein